jgi:hypothetical protein
MYGASDGVVTVSPDGVVGDILTVAPASGRPFEVSVTVPLTIAASIGATPASTAENSDIWSAKATSTIVNATIIIFLFFILPFPMSLFNAGTIKDLLVPTNRGHLKS